MKFSSLVPSVLAAAGVAVASSAFAPAQAALLNGAGTCELSQFTTSTDCGGYFDGNDTASDIDAIFGGSWMEVVKVEEGEGDSDTGMGVTLNVDSIQDTSGSWSATGLNYDLYKYVAVLKGGPTFSAYKIATGTTSGTWNTDGIVTGGGQAGPGLSHMTFYKMDATPVPEPLTILGSATALGIGGLLKREQSKKNKNNKA